MITIPLSFLTLPLVLAVWALDCYLFLVILRLILARFASGHPAQAYKGLKDLTDPAPAVVERWLTRRTGRPAPEWGSWLIVIVALFLARNIIVAILV